VQGEVAKEISILGVERDKPSGNRRIGCGAQVGAWVSAVRLNRSRVHSKMPIPVVAPVVESLDKPSVYRDGEKKKDERPKAERASKRRTGNAAVVENGVVMHQK
jgi:hypothetical protein